MPLSEEEQRLLDEMERNLFGDTTDVHASSSRMGRVSSRGIMFGLAGVVLGAIGLIVGMATGFFVWGVLGFAFLLAGSIAALSMRERDHAKTAHSSTRSGARPRASFMERLEQRWDDQQH